MPKSCVYLSISRAPTSSKMSAAMTSPYCKDAHVAFSLDSRLRKAQVYAHIKAPGEGALLRGTEHQQHPGMLSPFPWHPGGSRTISRCLTRRDFLGQVLPICPGWVQAWKGTSWFAAVSAREEEEEEITSKASSAFAGIPAAREITAGMTQPSPRQKVRLSPSAIANNAAETLMARGTSGKHKVLVVSTSGDMVMDVTTVGR